VAVPQTRGVKVVATCLAVPVSRDEETKNRDANQQMGHKQSEVGGGGGGGGGPAYVGSPACLDPSCELENISPAKSRQGASGTTTSILLVHKML
jgi:hypothetical protein